MRNGTEFLYSVTLQNEELGQCLVRVKLREPTKYSPGFAIATCHKRQVKKQLRALMKNLAHE